MKTPADIPPGTRTAIEFNTYQVPAELGIKMPAQAASCVLGIDEEQFNAHVDYLEGQLRQDARTLLEDSEVVAALDALDLAAGSTVMAIGDSLTAYRRGYADLLRVLVGLRRPEERIKFANHAQSGYTSTHARRSTYMHYVQEEPDLVLVLLGGNDCQRFGGPGAATLVSPGEYRDNMEAIVQGFRAYTHARVVLLTPVPVIPDMLRRVPDFTRQHVTWVNTDLEVCADALRSLALQYELPFVDLMEAYGRDPDPGLYFLDGLHPGPSGQQVILRHLLQAIAGR